MAQERHYDMKDSGVEWIGEIPKEWDVERIKSLFSFGKGLPITKDDLVEEGISVISYGQIHAKFNTGVEVLPQLIRYVNANWLESTPHSLVSEGDFIFADTSEDMEGCGNCVYIDSLGEASQLFAGYHTITFKTKKPKHNKYFAYLFKSDAWRSQLRSRVSGVKLFSISRKILNLTTVIIPPLPEQTAIVAYLDEKCAAIDSIIAEAKATIEEYKAWKASVIFEAVTKGLDPNAEMKDSGVEWIGEIPMGWLRDKINRIYDIIGSGTTPKFDDAKDNSGPINWIQSGDVYLGGDITKVKNQIAESFLSEYSALKFYKPPFVVIAMYGASIGNMAISHISGCVNQACCVLGNPRENFNYTYYALQALKRHLLSSALGGGQPNISQQIIKAQWLPVPPLPEQTAIADYLDSKCAAIDAIIAEKETLIAELEAYKKSLIFETVTGKRRVC